MHHEIENGHENDLGDFVLQNIHRLIFIIIRLVIQPELAQTHKKLVRHRKRQMNDCSLVNTDGRHYGLETEGLHLIELDHFGKIFKALFCSKVKPRCYVPHYLNLNTNSVKVRLLFGVRVHHDDGDGQPDYPVDPQYGIVFVLIGQRVNSLEEAVRCL